VRFGFDKRKGEALREAVQTGQLFVDSRDFVGDMVVHLLDVEGLNEHRETIDLTECTRHFDEQHRFPIDDIVALCKRADCIIQRLMQRALTHQQIVQISQGLLAVFLVDRVQSIGPFLSRQGLSTPQRRPVP